MTETRQKKKRVEGFIQKRMRFFYRDPPYGTRFWILDPFIRSDEDPLTIRRIIDLLGDDYTPDKLRPVS